MKIYDSTIFLVNWDNYFCDPYWLKIGIQRIIKVDLRIATVDIPQQEIITKDNATCWN